MIPTIPLRTSISGQSFELQPEKEPAPFSYEHVETSRPITLSLDDFFAEAPLTGAELGEQFAKEKQEAIDSCAADALIYLKELPVAAVIEICVLRNQTVPKTTIQDIVMVAAQMLEKQKEKKNASK